jgi:hypothetical protein
MVYALIEELSQIIHIDRYMRKRQCEDFLSKFELFRQQRELISESIVI